MRQPGRRSRFTAAEIEAIRAAYGQYRDGREARWRVMRELWVSEGCFARIGRGILGKKSREA